MADHQPMFLSANPSPPFRPDTPGPFDNPASSLRKRLSSIRSRIAREQLLFGNAKVNRRAVEERVEQLQQHDEQDLKQNETAVGVGSGTPVQNDDSGGSDTISPSSEATSWAILNENGQGEENKQSS